MVSPGLDTIHQATAVIQELGIPKGVVDVAADTGEFASIYFTIDVPEEYIPRIWHEAIRNNNRLVKCGSLAIQIGTGPMLWMRNRFHAPEQPLPSKYNIQLSLALALQDLPLNFGRIADCSSSLLCH